MENNIPTAEELLADNIDYLKEVISDNDTYLFYRDVIINFAKTYAEYHVESALNAAWMKSEIDIPDGAYFDNYVDPDRIEINKKSILTAYPNHLIK